MDDSPIVACPHCDALHTVVPLRAGESAVCSHCAYVLFRGSKLTVSDWLAWVIGALLLFVIANLTPLVHLTLQGKTLSPNLPSALWLMWEQGHYALSIMTGLMGVWFPFFLLLFRFWALLLIKQRRAAGDFAAGMRAMAVLEHWSMVPVVFLSVLVALVKFAGLARVELASGIWAYAVLMLVYTATAKLDSKRLWELAAQAGLVHAHASQLDPEQYVRCMACGLTQTPATDETQCERCASYLHKRKPEMRVRAMALLMAAMVLYVPANVFPIMEIRSPFGASDHTILGGVITLWQSGSPDLAIIVFTASVVVPALKFVVLLILLFDRRWRGRVVQRQRTRSYEVIEFIGQWSMLDVFVVVLMGAMANFPGLSQVIAGPAAVSFGLVVVLTMLATLSFDPRVGWDQRGVAAQANGHTSNSSFNQLGKQ